ncbi:MAG: hypothetical protein FWD52_04680 [Candidatus Bathyarchaeota archaeon]|nr:hypothetical protein [Candidatus Termiticorpusculum sp.]
MYRNALEQLEDKHRLNPYYTILRKLTDEEKQLLVTINSEKLEEAFSFLRVENKYSHVAFHLYQQNDESGMHSTIRGCSKDELEIILHCVYRCYQNFKHLSPNPSTDKSLKQRYHKSVKIDAFLKSQIKFMELR